MRGRPFTRSDQGCRGGSPGRPPSQAGWDGWVGLDQKEVSGERAAGGGTSMCKGKPRGTQGTSASEGALSAGQKRKGMVGLVSVSELNGSWEGLEEGDTEVIRGQVFQP